MAERKRSTNVRVQDLPDQLTASPTALLHCPACGNDYSAHRGGYFWAAPTHVFRCECGEALILARRRVVYEVA